MFKVEFYKADGTLVTGEHHTRKAACHQSKKAGVPYAYITDPNGIREKVRFDHLGDSVTPDGGHRRTYNDRLRKEGRAGKFKGRLK